MGSGKSTLGRRLARRFDLPFFDSDTEIERQTGASIAWIFDIEGEDGFRKRESDTLNSLLNKNEKMVLATGGGIVISEKNRALLKSSNAIVIYLNTPIETLTSRIELSKNRPLLKDKPVKEVLEALHTQRNDWYLEVADIVFNVESGKVLNTIKKLHKAVIDFKE